MSPRDWYDVTRGGWDGPPGTINPRRVHRLYGGPLDGETRQVPDGHGPLDALQYDGSVGPLFDDPSAYKIIRYDFFKCIHAPRPGCEGPIGLEEVYATSAEAIPWLA